MENFSTANSRESTEYGGGQRTLMANVEDKKDAVSGAINESPENEQMLGLYCAKWRSNHGHASWCFRDGLLAMQLFVSLSSFPAASSRALTLDLIVLVVWFFFFQFLSLSSLRLCLSNINYVLGKLVLRHCTLLLLVVLIAIVVRHLL